MKDKNTVFYKCPICGNIIEVVNGDIKRVKCCGKELELFMLSEYGPGFPFWLPKGMILRRNLENYWFKVHTTSDGNKQFSAVGNELIMGRWIKGRLAAAGLVSPVNDTGRDVERTGMITKEMLKAYGCSHLVLTKTTQQAIDDEGNVLDVWTFSFAGNEE